MILKATKMVINFAIFIIVLLTAKSILGMKFILWRFDREISKWIYLFSNCINEGILIFFQV
jgi:hypothetical protein